MITVVAASTITALKITNHAVSDVGTMSSESWLIAPSSWHGRSQAAHAAGCHVVEPHEQGAVEEQRDELHGEDDGSPNQRPDPQPSPAK
jgi:hypothetical protein